MKVSICIPAYQNSKGLKRLLHSIACQDFFDYEVVIADDSIDNHCFEVVREFLNSGNLKNKIIYHKNERRLGSPKNWNKTLDLASGDFIKLMHHDDEFATASSLSSLIKKLDEESECILIACASVDVKKGRLFKRNKLDPDALREISQTPEILLMGNVIGSPSATIWRSGVYRFNESLVWLVDLDFYLRVIRNASLGYLDQELIKIHIGEPGQITKKCIYDTELILRETLFVYKSIDENVKYSRSFQEFWIHIFEYCNLRNIRFVKNYELSESDFNFLTECYSIFKKNYLYRTPIIFKYVIKRTLYKIMNI